MKVSVGKKYRTEGGEPMRVLCIDSGDPNYPVICVDSTGSAKEYTADGRYYAEREDEFKDLVEISPYETWNIDDKIFVSDTDQCWHPRHFAGISAEGKPLAWLDGKTSHTETKFMAWAVAKLA